MGLGSSCSAKYGGPKKGTDQALYPVQKVNSQVRGVTERYLLEEEKWTNGWNISLGSALVGKSSGIAQWLRCLFQVPRPGVQFLIYRDISMLLG